MFELLVLVLFVWLSVKAVGLTLKLNWGAAKIFAAILSVVAFPLMLICLLFAGGVILLLPLLLIAAVCGIAKCFD